MMVSNADSEWRERLLRHAPIAGIAAAALSVLFVAFAASHAPGAVWFGALVGVVGITVTYLTLKRANRLSIDFADTRLRALERDNADLEAKIAEFEALKCESDTILSAVRAHLMMIGPSFRIQSRYSTELENVFHQQNLGNENFLNVLQRILSERMFKTARDYLALLFDNTKKERTILKVNPLEEVEINVTNPDGTTNVRYLGFSFRRIVENEVVVKALVSVEDVTDRVTLERNLRESEQKKVKQFELLIGILHVDPRDLDGFVTMAIEQLGVIDEALDASDFATAMSGQNALLHQRLDVVLQRVHNLKGNASLLRLEHFERKAQEFEQQLLDLKYRPTLGGDDFLTVVVWIAEFRSDLDDLQVLRTKLVGIQRNFATREEAADPLVQSIISLAQSLGNKLGKAVKVNAQNFDSRTLSVERRMAVKDVLVQLIRNSLAHGIESPAERAAAKKPAVGTIDIRSTAGPSPGSFALTYRDDGAGLDPQKIRAHAITVGLLQREHAARIGDSEVAGLIFAPGFSTAVVDIGTAGRGMGMSVVKQRIVDDCGGEIGVNSDPGRFCEFSFVLPSTTLRAVKSFATAEAG